MIAVGREHVGASRPKSRTLRAQHVPADTQPIIVAPAHEADKKNWNGFTVYYNAGANYTETQKQIARQCLQDCRAARDGATLIIHDNDPSTPLYEETLP